MRILTSLLVVASLGAGVHCQDVLQPPSPFDLSGVPTLTDDLQQLLSPDSKIILPSHPTFLNATKRHAEFGAPIVGCVVEVADEQDIITVLDYSRKHSIPIHFQATGHAWSTLNSTVANNALLLKVNRLKDIEVAPDKETMLISPGVTVKDANAAAYAAGKQLTIGSCNCVGVIGASLGGGHGRLQGYYGIMGDAIVEARVLLASGEIIDVSEQSHHDLLWGLKGAGFNFGIVLKARLKINDLINSGLVYNADKVFSEDKLEAVFNVMNRVTPPPKEISMYVGYAWFDPLQQVVVLIDFTYQGPDGEEAGRAQFSEWFGDIEGLLEWDDVHPWNRLNELGTAGITAGLCAPEQRKNTFTASLLTYDLTAVRLVYDEFKEVVTSDPRFAKSLIAWESYPQAGVRAVQQGSTAYPHRDASHLILLQYWYEDAELDEKASRIGRRAREILYQYSGFSEQKPRVYVNYAHGDESVEEMYGHEAWRLEKLRALKETYDPDGVFSTFHPL